MHILQKHLIDADDFNSVNDIIKTIQSVISSGTITRQEYPSAYLLNPMQPSHA